MNIKLAVTNLSPGKRQQLERTKEWLLRLLAEAESKQQQLDSAAASLLEARSRRDQYDREAATDEKAALKCAAAEIQIRKLEPLVAGLEKSLSSDLKTIGLQIVTVRKDDIIKVIWPDLEGQLHAQIKKMLEPIFAPKYLDGWTNEILPSSDRYIQVVRYLNRPVPEVTDIHEARQALGEVIKELDTILSGRALLEIGAPQDPPPVPEKPKLARKPILSDADLKRLREEGDAILRRVSLTSRAAGPQP